MIAQHSRGAYHAHLRRLEADGTWTIIRTERDGGDLVDWWLDNRPADLVGVYQTIGCSRAACAPGSMK